MIIFWTIRYLDTRDKEFKDRHLWLDTSSLDAATKAAVELCQELAGPGGSRDILRYRDLFEERNHSAEEIPELSTRSGGGSSMALPFYFEDENGTELTDQRMGQVLTGDPDTIMIPSGAKQHDIDFSFAPKPPIDLRQIKISKPDLDTLTYFSRDFRELEASCFLTEGPGTVFAAPGSAPVLQTAVSDDEIRSFVTIFRRLYMTGEPGNFVKAAEAFASALLPHSLAKWVQGVGNEYKNTLSSTPNFVPFPQKGGVTFTRKRVIDAFIYTQYAHQGDEKRERQYAKCLAEMNGQRPMLFQVFLQSVWECALKIRKAGADIARFTEQYCKHHALTPSAVGPASEYAGLGQLEKQPDREARIFNEKVEELARTLWESADQPEGGPTEFLNQAREELREAMHNADRDG